MTMSVPVKTEHDVRDIQIRRLRPSVVQTLGHMLDQGNHWKSVMAIVRDPNKDFQYKYSTADIGVIATYATDNRCTALFLDEWGTSAPLPRVSQLVQYLEEENLNQAASYLKKTIFGETISHNDDAEKWLEDALKAQEMAEEQKRQREEREEEERRDRAEDLRERRENRGEIVPNGHANHAQLEAAGVMDNRSEEAGHAPDDAAVLQNKVENHHQKACTHLKETEAVGGNKGIHLVVGNQANGHVENGGHAKQEEGIGNEEVHQESVANGIDNAAHRGPVRSNNTKRVSFKKETAAASNVSNATERIIQDVVIQGRDVSNIAQNDNRIEEESAEVRQCPSRPQLHRSYSEETQSSQEKIEMPPTKKFSKLSGDLIVFGVPKFSRHELYKATDGYKKANQLGAGVFGEVYYGKLKNGTEVAVKRLQNESMTTTSVSSGAEDPVASLFNNEVQNLAVCKHTNLVRLLGYFVETDMSCIVYEYMANGSLYDRLACMNDTPPLSATKRCSIALDVAEGLKYLHTELKPSVVHRDVKSMNILLNDRLEAKLGDFGIVRPMHVQQTQYTQQVAGTSSYMAPEAQYGQISEKGDVFAYGVVLLEILTGLKPSGNNIDGPLENQNIWIYFVFDHEERAEEGINLVKKYLDVKANWDKPDVVDSLVEIAWKRCCPSKREERESMSQIVDRLRKLKF